MEQQLDVRDLISQGNALLLDDRPAEAAAAFARAAHTDSQAVGAHLGLAQANFALEQPQIVTIACQHVRMLAPGTADALLADALTAATEDRLTDALQTLDRVSEMDPTRPYTYAMRSWVLRKMGQGYDASLAEARAARLTGKRDWSKLFPAVTSTSAYARPSAAPANGADLRPEGAPGSAQRITYDQQRSWQSARSGSRTAVRMRFLFRTQPVITYSIAAINIVVFLICVVFSNFDFFNTAAHGNNPIYQAGVFARPFLNDPTQWYRIITSMFLHEGIIHVGVNMLSLVLIGRLVETIFGPWRYLLFYFVGGIVGAVLQVYLDPLHGIIGASGGIAAVFGVLGAFFLLRRRQLGPAGNSMLVQWLFWLAINVYISVSAGNIAYWAHLGGLVTGFVLAVILLPPLGRRR
jgi:membrane associated rhomboid family serine protease